MKTNFLLLILLSLFLTSCSDNKSGIEVKHAVSYELPANSVNGAVYLELINNTEKDIVLISAQTPRAKKVEIRTTLEQDGLMKMRQLKSVTITPNESAAFSPGGNHLMLLNLTQPLKSGDQFMLDLNFKNGQTIQTHVMVVKPGTDAQHTHDHY